MSDHIRLRMMFCSRADLGLEQRRPLGEWEYLESTPDWQDKYSYRLVDIEGRVVLLSESSGEGA